MTIFDQPRMPSSSGEPTQTDFKRFADGTIIDLVRNPTLFPGNGLILYKPGSRARMGRQVEYKGTVYVPCKEPMIESMRLPRAIAANGISHSMDDVLTWMAKFLEEFVDFSSRAYLQAAARYALSTWFVHRQKMIPILSIVGPTGSGKTQLARCLSYLCRRSILLSDLNAATLRSMPLQLRPTLIMDEVKLTGDLIRLLRSGTHPYGFTYRGDRVIDLYCPKVLITQTPLPDEALINRAVQIHMSPTSRDMPGLIPSRIEHVETLVVPKIFRYFVDNYQYWNLEAPKVDVSCLSPHKRDVARALVEPFDCPFGEEDIVRLLQPQDENANAERFFTRESAVLWALLMHVENPNCKYALVGSIAASANGVMERRGERLQFTARAVGEILRRFGFKTESILDLGRGLWMTRDLAKMTWNLARHYDLIRVQPEVATTPMQNGSAAVKEEKKSCATAGPQNGGEPDEVCK